MTTTTQHSGYICEACGEYGTYRRQYDSTLCDECVKYDNSRSVGADITKKYLKRRS